MSEGALFFLATRNVRTCHHPVLLWQVFWECVFDHQEHAAEHDNCQYEKCDKALHRGEVQQVLSNALLVVLLLVVVVAARRSRRVAEQRSDL